MSQVFDDIQRDKSKVNKSRVIHLELGTRRSLKSIARLHAIISRECREKMCVDTVRVATLMLRVKKKSIFNIVVIAYILKVRHLVDQADNAR